MDYLGRLLANPLIAQLVGLAIGLFTSFFSWWVLFRWLTPKIVLADRISCTNAGSADEGADGWGPIYRMKLVNLGRRAFIDFQIRTFVRIKGLSAGNADSWVIIHLAMDVDGQQVYAFPLMMPVRQSKLWHNYRLYLKPDACLKYPFPEQIRQRATARTLILEDLFSIPETTAQLRVIVSGYDEFSGARKVFMKTYVQGDLGHGTFAKNSLQFIAGPNPPTKCE